MTKRKGQVMRWTKAQDAHVRKMWGKEAPQYIGIALSRSGDAVTQRAYHLGLEGQHKNPSRISRKEQRALEEDAMREMGDERLY